MSESFEQRVDLASARALARLQAGESVVDILRFLRDVEGIGTIGALMVARKLGSFGLRTARLLVEGHQAGDDLSHLRLADLRYLGDAEHLGYLGGFLTDAILYGQAWLRVVAVPRGVSFHRSEEAAGPGGWSAASIDQLRAEVAQAIGDPRWNGHFEVVRDEPGLLVLRFPKVTVRRG